MAKVPQFPFVISLEGITTEYLSVDPNDPSQYEWHKLPYEATVFTDTKQFKRLIGKSRTDYFGYCHACIKAIHPLFI